MFNWLTFQNGIIKLMCIERRNEKKKQQNQHKIELNETPNWFPVDTNTYYMKSSSRCGTVSQW